MKTEHEKSMQILYDRVKADAAAKKAYEVEREQRNHNKWLTAPEATEQ